MSKGAIAVLIVSSLVFAAIGFVFGQATQAAVNNPGPLVSESWVEDYVGKKMADMQLKIDELQAQLLQTPGQSTGTGTATGTDNLPQPADNNTPDTTNTSTTPSTVKVKIGNNSVNVRSDASTSASVVGSVSGGASMTYLSQKNDGDGRAWYKVRLSNGVEGWVAGWLCDDPQ